MWDRFRDWIDNPILTKHVRSRLRIQPFASSIVVVVVLCLCILWGGYELQGFQSGQAYECLIMLQAAILVVLGAGQIGVAVGGARNSGILDFHRVSPLTPTELALGFFFGAPIREYLLFASTLPFSAVFLAVGVPSWRGFVQVTILLFTTAWIVHGLAMLNSLILKAQANARGVAGAAIVMFFVLLNGVRMGRLLPSAIFFDEDGRLGFFGMSLPWLAVVLVYALPLLFFIFLAARRKMAWERVHPLSKPQAIAALALLGVLTLGGIWGQSAYDVLLIIALYTMVGAAFVLTMMVTPSRAEYFKGMWRAHKQARRHLPPWDDLALNRIFLVIACALLLLTTTVAWHAARSWGGAGRAPSMAAHPLGIAAAVLVVASFGLALQFFLLQFGARGKTYFALFLFITWLVPLIAGTILLATSTSTEWQGQVVFSLSPVFGIGMVASGADIPGGLSSGVQGAAITPVLLYTFVFSSLLTAARRRAHREFTLAAARTQAPGLKKPVLAA
jgi:hypothetical protein